MIPEDCSSSGPRFTNLPVPYGITVKFMLLLRHVVEPCTTHLQGTLGYLPLLGGIKFSDDLSFYLWWLADRDYITQMIDRLSFSVSGPRHIVTEFQDVGGAGALGEEEGAQACAVHHTNPTEFFLASATVSFL
jgi:hypothetical protein